MFAAAGRGDYTLGSDWGPKALAPTSVVQTLIVLVDGTVHSDGYITSIVIVSKLCK